MLFSILKFNNQILKFDTHAEQMEKILDKYNQHWYRKIQVHDPTTCIVTADSSEHTLATHNLEPFVNEMPKRFWLPVPPSSSFLNLFC